MGTYRHELQRSPRQRLIRGAFCCLSLLWGITWGGAPFAIAGEQGVLTQHNDNQRTGANTSETGLTPANVAGSTFGQLYALTVDGTIGAQPLYVPGVLTNGKPLNVLYIATRKNKIYAFDVGSASLTPSQRLLWQIELRDSRGFGAEELPGMDGRYSGDSRPLCHQTHGPVGIASTPVIDAATNTMYVVYRTASPFSPLQYKRSSVYDAKFYIRKVDVRTHATLGEQEIAVPGFDANKQLNRTGLLLQDGVIYLGFGGAVCDTGGGDPTKPDPHGWIVAIDATNLNTLATLNTTPHSSMGGVWQSGSGLAADGNGFVYALTGNNGLPGPNLDISTELNDAILQIQLNRPSLTLTERHFTAHNWFRLDSGERFPGDPQATLPCQPVFPCPGTVLHVAGDCDVGSGGPVVLPNGWVLGGGKQGQLYLIDPTNMGVAKQAFQAFYNSWHSGISSCDYDEDQSFGPNIHGTPVLWRPEGATYSLIYDMPEKDYLKAYRAFDDGHIDESPFLTTMDSDVRSPRGMPGGSLSLSADGGRNGVLWVSAVQQQSADAINTIGQFNGRLMAFDALSLTKLWESNDQVPFAKFIPPTIGGGKVFRAAYQDTIIVYGLGANGASGGSTTLLPARPVTAVWRDPDHLDLFMTSRDVGGGRVLSTNWEAVCPPPPAPPSGPPSLPATRGWRGWFSVDSLMDTVPDGDPLPVGYNFLASGASLVTAVWRPGSEHLDLFVTANNGQVMSIPWEPATQSLASGWKSWFQIGTTSLSVAPGQPVTAVWRNPNHLDLFVAGKDGRVMSTFFENNQWRPAWFAIDPATGIAAPGQPVTAVWRNTTHLDLFMTGKDGRVMSTFFENNQWQPAWFVIDPATGIAAPGQPVTAVWRNATHLDLFMTGKDGQVMSTFFENNQWQPAWFGINPATGTAPPGQMITAVWSNPNHLDLFMTAKDGRIMSTFFDNNQWNASGWFAI